MESKPLEIQKQTSNENRIEKLRLEVQQHKQNQLSKTETVKNPKKYLDTTIDKSREKTIGIIGEHVGRATGGIAGGAVGGVVGSVVGDKIAGSTGESVLGKSAEIGGKMYGKRLGAKLGKKYFMGKGSES